MIGAPPTAAGVRAALDDVTDPEIPVVTIADLGVLRDVSVEAGRVVVTLTPTYSGCPAMQEIEADVRGALAGRGWDDVEVRTVLAPAWTTDWMSERGREALRAYGIAPPARRAPGPVPVTLGSVAPGSVAPGSAAPGSSALAPAEPDCPRCASPRTEELTRFASTSCRSLWRCLDCREPFDHFKAH